MKRILFVSNEAENKLCSTQDAETELYLKLQMPLWFIKFHSATGSHVLHRIPEIKQRFSDVKQLYPLQNIDVV